jgi:hypothetical protein
MRSLEARLTGHTRELASRVHLLCKLVGRI